MLETILVIAALAIAAVLVLAARQPDEFRVSRTVTINAPPAAIYPHVSVPRAWQPWSPWAKMDPLAEITFGQPDTGVGASHTWKGKKTGEGTMTVTEVRPHDYVQFRLDFRKPFAATNYAEFQFVQEGAGTRVTWSMYGPNKFMGKLMSVFVNCETMVGTQFQQGLNDLKQLVEAGPATTAAA